MADDRYGTETDKRSFMLGMITAFCECVAGGCKRLALSPPLTREEYRHYAEEANGIIEKHGLSVFPGEFVEIHVPDAAGAGGQPGGIADAVCRAAELQPGGKHTHGLRRLAGIFPAAVIRLLKTAPVPGRLRSRRCYDIQVLRRQTEGLFSAGIQTPRWPSALRSAL